MPTSQQIYNNMQNIQKEYQSYTPANRNDVMADLSARVNNFAPQYSELRNTQAQAYAAPASDAEQFNQMYGSAPGQGPSVGSRFSSMLNHIGNLYGLANTQADVLGQSQGRLGDIANSAIGAYDAKRQGLKDQLDYQQNLYSQANQREMQQASLAQQTAAQRLAQQQADQQKANQIHNLLASGYNFNGGKDYLGSNLGGGTVLHYTDALRNELMNLGGQIERNPYATYLGQNGAGLFALPANTPGNTRGSMKINLPGYGSVYLDQLDNWNQNE